MNRLLYILIVWTLLLISACTNLEEDVYSSITETSYVYQKGDATKAIGAIYANLRTMYSPSNRTQEISSDEIIMPANTAGGWDDGGIYRLMHLHQWNAEHTYILSLWKNQYTGILLSNRLLQQLQDKLIPLAQNEVEKSLIAEVRALRAYHYWIIMDNWNNAPLITSVTNDLPTNSSREEMFDFILRELKESMPDLPNSKSTETYGRFTQCVVHALLANIYLNAQVYVNKQMWKECIEECDAVLNSGLYQLDDDYKTPFSTQNEKSLENIFVIPYDEVYALGFTYYKEALHKANKSTFNLESTPYGTGAYKGVPQFIDTYDLDDARLKATWLFGPQMKSNGEPCIGSYDLNNKPLIFDNKMPDGIQVGEGEGYRWLKYEIKQGAHNNLNNDFVIFRLAQIYMMKAESLLRLGKADEAAQLVSLVRKRAFKNHPEKANVTGTQLMESSSYKFGTVKNYNLSIQSNNYPEQFGRFYDELGWEFAGELMRRRDMIRFGTYTKVQWLSHERSDDFRTVFPIPQRVLDSNSRLSQNPNYL